MPFEARLRQVNKLYSDQNLYCKWNGINTDPTQNISLNITKFDLLSPEKYFIEIFYYDGSSNKYEFNSKYFLVTSTAIKWVVLHFYSSAKNQNMPFSAIFDFADNVSLGTNYLNIFITVGLVILGCVILTIFMHRCSKFFSRHNAHDLSNNSSRINQQIGNVPPVQRTILDFIEEREEYQNRAFIREEKKRQKNLAALDKLLNEQLKTEKFCDKEDKEFTNCTICLEDYVPDAEVIALVCRHTFHFICLKDWLLRALLHPKCPNCNDILLDLQHESSSESESDEYDDSENSSELGSHVNNIPNLNNNNPNANRNNNRNYGRNNTYTNLNRTNNNNNNNSNNNNIIRNNNNLNVNRVYSRVSTNVNINNNNGLNRSEVLIINNRFEILDSNSNNNNNNNAQASQDSPVGDRRSYENMMYIQHDRNNLNNANNSNHSNNLIRRSREDAFHNLSAISIDNRSLNNGDNFVVNSNNNANSNLQTGNNNNINNLIFRHDTNNYVLNPEQTEEDRV